MIFLRGRRYPCEVVRVLESLDFSRALWPHYLASSNQYSYLRNKMATDLDLFSFVHFKFCFHHPLHERNTRESQRVRQWASIGNGALGAHNSTYCT